MVRMKFSEKIPLLVASRKVSQADIAREIGVAAARISEWKNDEGSPSVHQAIRMARFLNVSLEYLLDDDMDKEPRLNDLTEDDRMVLRIFHHTGLTAEEAVERLQIKEMGIRQREPSHPQTGPARRPNT